MFLVSCLVASPAHFQKRSLSRRILRVLGVNYAWSLGMEQNSDYAFMRKISLRYPSKGIKELRAEVYRHIDD